MAKRNRITTGGPINRKWSPEELALFERLTEIATKGAEAGNSDDADWTDVYAAISGTVEMVAKQKEVATITAAWDEQDTWLKRKARMLSVKGLPT